MKIACPISQYAGPAADEPAVITGKCMYSYRHLDHIISGTADLLKQKGIGKGVRTALVGRNSIEYIAALWALWRTGAAAVPINFRFPSEYVKKIFQEASVGHGILNAPIVSHFRELGKGNIMTWDDMPVSIPAEYRQLHGSHEIEAENDAAIILTSGSSGSEKAVLHSFGNFYYNALGANENMPLEPGDRWLLSLPLFHVGGLGILFRCFLAGAAVVVAGPEESESLLESIEKYDVTHVSLVSTQLQRLLQEAGEPRRTRRTRRIQGLKAILLGGSAFPVPLIRRAISLNLPVYTTYGLSEMASQVTTVPENAPKEKLLTSGKLLNFRCLKIDENNEICVKGKTLFKGYVKEKTLSRPFDRVGWFHTGDLGRIDKEGYLQVLGRRDNMFISGGENIMPEEIEVILNRAAGVREALVVPLEDETYGSRPAAFLKPGPAAAINRDDVLNQLQRFLPRFKVPDVFYLWPDANGAGERSLKVKRSYFRDLLKRAEGLTLLFKKQE
jgi:O-succinylbenzoic acid--CoA ligase